MLYFVHREKWGGIVLKKNLCIIGCGSIGRRHAQAALKSDVVNLYGLCDINEAALADAKSQGIRTYTDFSDVLMDKNIDIITIATRNETHTSFTLRALEAGMHVICEKPVALSSRELIEMINASEKYNRLFTAHQNRRYDRDYLAVKNLTDSGKLGKIYNIESRVHGSRGIPSGWRRQKELGGGMLFDWGIHLIDQMINLIPGKIKSISCSLDHITVSEVDDGFFLEMAFEGGERARIEVGTYNMISLPRFYVRGKNGSAIVNDLGGTAEVKLLTAWDESDTLKNGKPISTMTPRDSLTTESYTMDIPMPDSHDFYRNFCAAIDKTEAQAVTHTDMLRALKIIETAFESESKNAIIKCDI